MKLPNLYILDKKKIRKQKPVPLVIGFFDGIHLGHKKLFQKTQREFNVLTFVNIPSKNKTLFSTLQRITNMTYLQPMPKNIFIYDIQKNNDVNLFRDVIKKYINPTKIIVGNKFKYGKNKLFGIDDLSKDFKLDVVKENEISTTTIKKLITNGKILQANKMLLLPYYLSGKVVHGKQLGTKLGFKTANIKVSNNLVLPKEGSYLGYTILDNKWHNSAIFIRNGIIESHLLNNFNKNIYSRTIVIVPLVFTHPTFKAKNFKHLQQIISSKIAEIQKAFNELK